MPVVRRRGFRRSTSASVRYSLIRNSAFGRRSGVATVRFSVAGDISLRCDFAMVFRAPAKSAVRRTTHLRTVGKRKFSAKQRPPEADAKGSRRSRLATVTWRRDAQRHSGTVSVFPQSVTVSREGSGRRLGLGGLMDRRPRGQPLASPAWRPHQNRKRVSERYVPPEARPRRRLRGGGRGSAQADAHFG